MIKPGMYGGPVFGGVARTEELGWQNHGPALDRPVACGKPTEEFTGQNSGPLSHQEGGKKHDTGKPMAGLMMQDFAKALAAVADVTTYGARKYTPSGWVNVPDANRRYTDALYRHLLAYAAGETHDAESGLPHIAHAAWNVLALLEMETRGWHDDV